MRSWLSLTRVGALILLTGLAACRDGGNTGVEVRFYSLGDPADALIESELEALEELYGAYVRFKTVKTKVGGMTQSELEVKQFGLGTHGIVVFFANGVPATQLEGHDWSRSDIESAIRYAIQ